MNNTSQYDVREIFGPDLLATESIVWSGKPDPSILFAPVDRFLVPFSLLWGGFAFFWEGTVIASLLGGEDHSGNGGSLWLFVIFGIPMVAMGLYFIFGRFIYKRMQKKRTYYAITNERVLVLNNLGGRHLTAAFIREIPSIEKSTNPKGIGSLVFGQVSLVTQWGANTGMDFLGMASKGQPPAFFDIHNVDRVYELVNEQRVAARQGER